MRWLLSRVRPVQSPKVSAPFLRVLFCIQNFRMCLRGCWRIFNPSRTIWIVCPIRYPQEYPLLLLVLSPSDRSSGGASVESCLSLSSLLLQGLQSSYLGLPFDCKRRPRKFAPCLLFSSSRDGESLDRIYSLISVCIHFCCRLSSCSVMRRG